MKTISLETTKKGYPATWEQGGGMTNSGACTIIADKEGNKKQAIFIRLGGHLSNGNHALIIVEKGDIVIECSHLREQYTISVYQIEKINIITDTINKEVSFSADMELINEFSYGDWKKDLDKKFGVAVNVAMQKTKTYHCKQAMYINEPLKKEIV